MTNFALFIFSVLAILASPGPTNALLSTSAALVGIRRSLPSMSAEILGYFVAIAVLKTASAPLIALWPPLALGLKAALVVYLLWLAWILWRSAERVTPGTNVVSWRRVFVTTLLNPKGPIFAFGVFPVVGGLRDIVLHFGAFAVITLVVAFGWMTLGTFFGRLVERNDLHVSLPRIAAVVLILFAGLLMTSITNLVPASAL